MARGDFWTRSINYLASLRWGWSSPLLVARRDIGNVHPVSLIQHIPADIDWQAIGLAPAGHNWFDYFG